MNQIDLALALAWKRSGDLREIARERIQILFGLAKDNFRRNKLLSKRYLELARKVGMKVGVRLPLEYRMQICKGCSNLLVPGVNARVRISPEFGATVLITCLDCGTKKRYPTVRERRSRRKN